MVKIEKLEIGALNLKNVLRYMGMWGGEPPKELISKIEKAEKKMLPELSGRVAYIETPVIRTGDDRIELEGIVFESKALARHLSGCDRAVLMAATVGTGADKLRQRAAVDSTVSELIFDALGTEAIESLCDSFCDAYAARNGEVTPRFSPGYGDLDLAYQKDLVAVLDTNRRIALSLTDSLLMTPTKSVTAIMGIKNT
ncbi:MAG: hypothetical protein J6Z46_01045 [Lachnospiraceae bacterium]|nr:hypothetical protein [Lachnospiraceae bacterium]MBP5248574.1 hypothetical protein [Lachnospiraceae bacterium]